jgi:hypothetical protein
MSLGLSGGKRSNYGHGVTMLVGCSGLPGAIQICFRLLLIASDKHAITMQPITPTNRIIILQYPKQ